MIHLKSNTLPASNLRSREGFIYQLGVFERVNVGLSYVTISFLLLFRKRASPHSRLAPLNVQLMSWEDIRPKIGH